MSSVLSNIDVVNLLYSRGAEVVLIWKMVYVLLLLSADISIRMQVYLKNMISNMNLKK